MTIEIHIRFECPLCGMGRIQSAYVGEPFKFGGTESTSLSSVLSRPCTNCRDIVRVIQPLLPFLRDLAEREKTLDVLKGV